MGPGWVKNDKKWLFSYHPATSLPIQFSLNTKSLRTIVSKHTMQTKRFKLTGLLELLSASVALICTANQLTGFYMRVTLAHNGLKHYKSLFFFTETNC